MKHTKTLVRCLALLLPAADFIIIGEFLVNNYKQALSILKSEPAFVKQMQDQGIADTSIFKGWLAEEKTYLELLSREPLEESLAMEYWQKLVNPGASE